MKYKILNITKRLICLPIGIVFLPLVLLVNAIRIGYANKDVNTLILITILLVLLVIAIT